MTTKLQKLAEEADQEMERDDLQYANSPSNMKSELLHFLKMRRFWYKNPITPHSSLAQIEMMIRLAELDDVIKVIEEDDFYD